MNAKQIGSNISRWKLSKPDVDITEFQERVLKEKSLEFVKSIWVNDGTISPLDLYCYLKARFGHSESLLMKYRDDSTNNLIQWHYDIFLYECRIEFIAINTHLEIHITNKQTISEEEWKLIICNIKDDFTNYKTEISNIRQSLETWALFINPFKRLSIIVDTLEKRLELLDITEPAPLPHSITKEQYSKYSIDFKKWETNISEAMLLGTSIKMITPVFCEAFVNLLIFLLSKKEVKLDKRIYDDLIKKPIDIRVRSLNLYCDGFTKNIDSDNEAFKKFHTLMNSRNDFLHGNIDPYRLKFANVYFDKTIPLFKDEQSLLRREIVNSTRYVEKESSLNDIKIARDFIGFVINHLDLKYQHMVKMLSAEKYPGWREDTKKVGILFPEAIAEMIPFKNEDNGICTMNPN